MACRISYKKRVNCHTTEMRLCQALKVSSRPYKCQWVHAVISSHHLEGPFYNVAHFSARLSSKPLGTAEKVGLTQIKAKTTITAARLMNDASAVSCMWC